MVDLYVAAVSSNALQPTGLCARAGMYVASCSKRVCLALGTIGVYNIESACDGINYMFGHRYYTP